MKNQSTGDEEEDSGAIRMFNAMAGFFTFSKRPWLFGLGSLAVTFLSTVCFVMCFVATAEVGCWCSIHMFLVYYGGAALLALPGIRSVIGILALFIGSVLFACLWVYLFVLP